MTSWWLVDFDTFPLKTIIKSKSLSNQQFSISIKQPVTFSLGAEIKENDGKLYLNLFSLLLDNSWFMMINDG